MMIRKGYKFIRTMEASLDGGTRVVIDVYGRKNSLLYVANPPEGMVINPEFRKKKGAVLPDAEGRLWLRFEGPLFIAKERIV